MLISIKKSLILGSILLGMASTHVIAQAVPDWKEDGNTLSCVYAKDAPGKAVKSLPLPIYEKPNDAQPKLVIKDGGFVAFFAVSKQGNWVKLKGSSNSAPHFRDGQFAGYAKASDLYFAALRNCN